MTATLSPEQCAQYQRDGYLFPIDCLTPDEVRHYRTQLEAFEREQGDTFGRLPGLVGNSLFPPRCFFRTEERFVLQLSGTLKTSRGGRVPDASEIRMYSCLGGNQPDKENGT